MYANTAKMSTTRKVTMLAALSAIAYVLMVVGRIPVVSFLKYDPKDVIIIFGGFLYGPMSAFLISLVVSLVEMFTVSDTGIIGFFMNVLSSCAFACTASIIYKKRQTLKGAVAGLIAGVLLTVAVMLLWNYLITPFHMGVPRDAVAGMLLPVFLPFNLLKGGLNATLTLLLYKPLVRALRGANLLPARELSEETPAVSRKASLGVMLTAALVLVSCVMVVLVLQGVL